MRMFLARRGRLRLRDGSIARRLEQLYARRLHLVSGREVEPDLVELVFVKLKSAARRATVRAAEVASGGGLASGCKWVEGGGSRLAARQR